MRPSVERRGWTDDDIDDVLNNPVETKAAVDRRNDDPATIHYGPDGHYVIKNDKTGEIIQTSDRNDPNWIDDSTNQPVEPRE